MNHDNFQSPERIDTPNFLRLAHELNKFKNPRVAADLVLAVAGPILREEDGQRERES